MTDNYSTDKLMWHIAKRELYDNLNSLRFALTTVLLIGLMVTNAVVHLKEHPERIKEYRDNVARYHNKLSSNAQDSLYELAQKGPDYMFKEPSPLRFCAEAGESFLSNSVEGGFHRWSTDKIKDFWILAYPPSFPSRNVRPEAIKIDWGFIIGYVLSLVTLLFTFDSISGERERGTLRLMLSNSVPRHNILIGKYIGTLISICIPFTLAVLMNLLFITTSSDVHLNAEAWGRLGIIFFIAILYTCLFLALGLLVSSRVQRSAVSLVILLLVWVVFVVFMPSTLVSIAGGASSSAPKYDFTDHSWQLHNEVSEEYYTNIETTTEDSIERIQIDAEYVTKDAKQQEQLHEEQLNRQISQVSKARDITRISPVTIVQHLLESFAGTGFERHLQFIDNVKSYAQEYRTFIIDTDRSDPESLHIYGVRNGMSKKPVNPEAVPKFKDRLDFSKDFNAAAMELMLLVLFVVVLLSGAYLAFIRVEV